MAEPTYWSGFPLLPPIGSMVLINHGRDEQDHICIVDGYEVHPPADPVKQKSHFRVHLKLHYLDAPEVPNQRSLEDVKPLSRARSIYRGEVGDAEN